MKLLIGYIVVYVGTKIWFSRKKNRPKLCSVARVVTMLVHICFAIYIVNETSVFFQQQSSEELVGPLIVAFGFSTSGYFLFKLRLFEHLLLFTCLFTILVLVFSPRLFR